MKKKIWAISALVLFALLFHAAPATAQTYTYRLVKTVTRYGEVREVGPKDHVFGNYKTYIHFNSDKSSFYIAKYDGSRAGFPDEGSGFGSGFANQDIPSGNFSGICTAVRDPVDFVYTGNQGDIRVYQCRRPLLALNFQTRTSYITGYATDYAKFNSDYTRINVVQSYDRGMYGIYPFKNITEDGMTFVFEIVREANGAGSEFY